MKLLNLLTLCLLFTSITLTAQAKDPTPSSPTSDPALRLVQEPREQSKFLAVQKEGLKTIDWAAPDLSAGMIATSL